MSWDEINELILLPQTSEERRIYREKFAEGQPYSQIYKWSEQLNRNYLVFEGNAVVLLDYMDRFQKGNIIYGDGVIDIKLVLEKPDIQYHIAIRATRYLANFLGSAAALRDTTRTLVLNRIGNADFAREYKEQLLVRFGNSFEAKFIKKLRNFTLHRALPLFGPNIELVRNGDLYTAFPDITLSSQDLLSWEGWDEPLKVEIVKRADDEGYLHIKDVISKYVEEQREFTFWLMKRFVSEFRYEVATMNQVVRDLRQSSN